MVWDDISDTFSDLADDARDAASSVGDRISDAASDAHARISEATDKSAHASKFGKCHVHFTRADALVADLIADIHSVGKDIAALLDASLALAADAPKKMNKGWWDDFVTGLENTRDRISSAASDAADSISDRMNSDEDEDGDKDNWWEEWRRQIAEAAQEASDRIRSATSDEEKFLNVLISKANDKDWSWDWDSFTDALDDMRDRITDATSGATETIEEAEDKSKHMCHHRDRKSVV